MAKITRMIDGIIGTTEADEKRREQLTSLQKMAKAKSDAFEAELKKMLAVESLGRVEIIGGRAFRYRNGQHANISHNCDEAIREAIDDFFKGKSGIKDGFQKIVKQGISGLIGDTSIGETEDHMFFVYPENNAVVRADVKAYKYTFSSKGLLVDDVENVFVYTMAKSIVDHTKLTVDELLYMVTEMAGAENADLKVVKDFIGELKECWEMLEGENTMPQQLLAQAELAEATRVAKLVCGEKAVRATMAGEAAREAEAAE